jgi:hypothetical protein
VGGTPALARWAWQIALPLVRLEEVGLRGFHDTVQGRRLDLGRPRKKPVSPAK